jgi:hypothetical protein
VLIGHHAPALVLPRVRPSIPAVGAHVRVDAQFVLTYVPDSVNVHASDPVGRSAEARIPVPPQEIVAAVPCTVIVPVVKLGVHMAPVQVVNSGHACAPARDATLPATAQVK